MTTSESAAQTGLSELEKQSLEFNQLKLRLLVGFIAFLLPILTPLIASTPLSSISGSYYTEARDVFVGSLFVVGALLWAYTVRPPQPLKEQDESTARKRIRAVTRIPKRGEQTVITTVGALAAVVAALYPTACEGCGAEPKSVVHYIAAVILFLMIAYFCLFIFRDSANAKANEKSTIAGTKQKRRAGLYLGCGLGILVCLLGAGGAQLTMAPETRAALAVTFWAESASLWLFAASWMVASRVFPWFTDREERLMLLQGEPKKQEGQASA